MLFLCMAGGCMSHDISDIEDNGQWVSIYNAPLTCGYILHDDKIFGILIDMAEAYDEKTFWVDNIDEAMLIPNADISTFEVNLADNCAQPYAKDKNNVYCPIDVTYYEWADEAYEAYSMVFCGRIIVDGADPKTFKYLGNEYAVDKNHMYLRGERIKWDDGIIETYKSVERSDTTGSL